MGLRQMGEQNNGTQGTMNRKKPNLGSLTALAPKNQA